MAREAILVVEDEEDILEVISYNLIKEGFRVSGAATGEEALKSIREEPPALVLLDLMLPGIGGYEICRQLKLDSATASIPVIMLTARGEEEDIVRGLERGADDYIVKPFRPKELIARIRSVLRRQPKPKAETDPVLKLQGLIIDAGRHEVWLDGESIKLSFSEFRILHFLAGRPGWIYTRDQIISAIRGEDHSVTDRAVDVQIAGLRKKLGEAGQLIETVRSVGYRFRELS